MTGVTWRYRQCPSCDVVLPASEFETLTYGSNWNTTGVAIRQCPTCFHQGETQDFQTVYQGARVSQRIPPPYKVNPLLPPPSESNPLLPPTAERPPILDLFDAYCAETVDMGVAFWNFCEAMGWEMAEAPGRLMVAYNGNSPSVVMNRFGIKPR